MKNVLGIAIAILTLIACDSGHEGKLKVMGTVDGLREGKLYLQKIRDTQLIDMDSAIIDGDPSFELFADLDEPELIYLYLDKKDRSAYDDRLAIFTGDSTITVTTELKKFETAAVVSGSDNHDLLEQFNQVKGRLDQEQFELMKRSAALQEVEEPEYDEIEKLQRDIEAHLKKRYLYVINFANNNKDHEVAPYALLTEAFDANPVWLDSIYSVMPKKIRKSLYGKKLAEQIELRKKELQDN